MKSNQTKHKQMSIFNKLSTLSVRQINWLVTTWALKRQEKFSRCDETTEDKSEKPQDTSSEKSAPVGPVLVKEDGHCYGGICKSSCQ